ncbi:hypothetical protein DAMNIGENAA_32710 [Desulforhabdus amnigena]|uniref:Uncharacterized protein n=1 Tax=Desulforhabdus amnigena TaxID=40218 RepID=A0A9W6FVY8_9BACT|nr:hypothetical protein DAMNIGENAA_32710 [Desulforhabdus amnigena]
MVIVHELRYFPAMALIGENGKGEGKGYLEKIFGHFKVLTKIINYDRYLGYRCSGRLHGRSGRFQRWFLTAFGEVQGKG